MTSTTARIASATIGGIVTSLLGGIGASLADVEADYGYGPQIGIAVFGCLFGWLLAGVRRSAGVR